VRRRSVRADELGRYDFLGEYVADLPDVVDLDAIRDAASASAADPLGGRPWPTGARSRSATASTSPW
jgi:phosphoglucomutase